MQPMPSLSGGERSIAIQEIQACSHVTYSYSNHLSALPVACPQCGIKVEAIPWAQGKNPSSQVFVVTLATLSRLLACDVVARLLGVSLGAMRTAVRSAVEYGFSKREIDEMLYIVIDESTRLSYRKHFCPIPDPLLW